MRWVAFSSYQKLFRQLIRPHLEKWVFEIRLVAEVGSHLPMRIYFPGLTLTGFTRLNIVDNSLPELSKSRIRVRQYVGSVPISVKNGNNSVSVVTLIDSIKIIPQSSWTGGNLPLKSIDHDFQIDESSKFYDWLRALSQNIQWSKPAFERWKGKCVRTIASQWFNLNVWPITFQHQ